MPSKNPPDALRVVSDEFDILVTCPTGASHQEKGMPCQDACMAALQYYRGYPYTALAVADGHGSDKYSRSDVGAHLAMEAVRNAASQLVQGSVHLMEEKPKDWHSRIDLKYEMENRFAKTMIKSWHELVKEHARQYPEMGVNPDAPPSVERYGTTVAVCVLFQQRLLAGVIGDSQVYRVHLDKQTQKPVVRRVLPETQESVGLSTDSLISQRKAYDAWQVALEEIYPISAPEMILLTTDGMTDSLEDLEQTIRSIYDHATNPKRGMEWIRRELPKVLTQWSEDGVGDDMGVVLVLAKNAGMSANNTGSVGPKQELAS